MTIDLTKWVVHKDNDCDCVPRRDFLKAACEDTLFVVLEWFAYDFPAGSGFRSLFYERCGGRKGAKLWDGYRLRPWYKLVPICIIFCLVGLPVMCIKLIAVAKRV